MNVKHNFDFSDKSDSLRVAGFQEAVISVSDFEKALWFYQNSYGWEIIHQGKVPKDLQPLWQLEDSIEIQEAVLRNPNTKSGYLRVLKFHGVEQQLIRSSANTWDTGGIFDLNIRVQDMGTQYPEFERNGWNGYAKPHRYTFDIYDVSEVLMQGPDGIVFAGIQRFNPPLEGFEFDKVSRIFNSSLISKDLEASHDFYHNKLGFSLAFETAGDSRNEGPNVLGIPPNINGNVRVPIKIYKPDPNDYGSIELLQLMDLEGEDHAQHAHPPNLGILMLRFPVRSIRDYSEFISNNGVEINTRASNIRLEPYGQVNIVTVRTTEGAWFEFVELLNH